MKPDISIIVPVYNTEAYLRECLNSLVHQTLTNIEIICINDGSTDKALGILEEYAEKDNRVIVISQKNQGVSSARNAGLKYVHGEYYMFVDSDDWIDPETCGDMYQAAKKNSADCVMCSYIREYEGHSAISYIWKEPEFVWKEAEVAKNFHRRLFGPVGSELFNPERMDILVTPCMQLFKTERFAGILFYDDREIGTFEDGLYQMDVYAGCRCFVYKKTPFYHYRKTNEASITTVYKVDLAEKWQRLYQIIKGKIINNKLEYMYREALDNRIALSVLGFGLNQIRSGKGMLQNSRDIREILNNDIFGHSLNGLKLSYMPIHWKLFFGLCKVKSAIFVVFLLETIEFLRKRVRH